MRKLILIISLFLCGHFVLNAQSITNSDRRVMNKLVLSLIDDYEMFSSLKDKADRYQYLNLFEKKDSKIFCDLLTHDSCYLSDIPIALYADYVLQNCVGVTVELRNIKRGELNFVNDEWLYSVNFDKYIEYTDNNGILFPIDTASSTYNIDMVCKINQALSECRIISIKCLNTTEFAPLDNGYIVQKHYTEKEAEYDDKVTIGEKTLSFNSFKQAYSPRGEIGLFDDDVKLTTELLADEAAYDYIQFKYKAKHIRLKGRYGFTIGDAYSVSSNYKFDKVVSSGSEIGLDIGYAFPLSKSLKLGIFSGLGFSTTKLLLQTDKINYSYISSDSYGYQYNRVYDFENMSQGVDLMDLLIPLYFSWEIKIAKPVTLILDMGTKVFLNANVRNNPFHVSGSVSGEYSSGIVTEGGEAFGHIDKDYNAFISAVAFNRERVDLSLMANVGFDVNLFKNILYLEAKFGYEKGLKESYKSNEEFFYDASQGIYPLVYSYIEQEDVVVRPIADCVSFTRQALWANVGFMFKF